MIIKKYVVLVVLVCMTTILSAQKQGYIIKNNGDSISGEIKLIGLGVRSESADYKLILSDGEKMKFTAQDVKYMNIDGVEFYSQLTRPESTKKKLMDDYDLMQVIKKNGSNILYARWYYSGGGSSKSKAYDFLVYSQGKCIGKLINRRTDREILEKYFPDEKVWIQKLMDDGIFKTLKKEQFSFKNKTRNR